MLERIRAFMYGRNGMDGLNIALLVFYLLLGLLLPRYFIFRLIMLIPLGLAAFRVFSRNLPARRTENDRFMVYFNKVKDFCTKWNRRLQDTKHKYVKCRTCGQTLRLPKGKGKLNITCPKCGAKFARKT